MPDGPGDDLGITLTGREDLDAIFSHAYDELRRLAGSVRSREANATLNPTQLVNEAWLKLASAPPRGAVSQLHFKRIAARAMRQVLVEAARRRGADKRGGGMALVTLDTAAEAVPTGASELLALDTALDELASVSPRQAAMIECRFFGGLEVAETAELLGVSEATILRDWRAARAWLVSTLRGEP